MEFLKNVPLKSLKTALSQKKKSNHVAQNVNKDRNYGYLNTLWYR